VPTRLGLTKLIFADALLLCGVVSALASDLPDRKLTPGSAVKVPVEMLCAKGYAKSVHHVSGSRPPSAFDHKDLTFEFKSYGSSAYVCESRSSETGAGV